MYFFPLLQHILGMQHVTKCPILVLIHQVIYRTSRVPTWFQLTQVNAWLVTSTCIDHCIIDPHWVDTKNSSVNTNIKCQYWPIAIQAKLERGLGPSFPCFHKGADVWHCSVRRCFWKHSSHEVVLWGMLDTWIPSRLRLDDWDCHIDHMSWLCSARRQSKRCKRGNALPSSRVVA